MDLDCTKTITFQKFGHKMALAVSRPWSIKSIRDHNQLTEENDIDNKCDWTELDHYYGLVKRQILRYQSPTSHLFPITSTDTEHGSIRCITCCYKISNIICR